jgi:hypothetical protein
MKRDVTCGSMSRSTDPSGLVLNVFRWLRVYQNILYANADVT